MADSAIGVTSTTSATGAAEQTDSAGPAGLDALAQAAAVRAGEVSPVELVEYHLARIAELDGVVGAFVTITADAAREQARAAERRLLGGDRSDLPPLFGVPTAIKDLTATAGVRTTFGSRAFAGFVPETDANCVALLRAAGTISLGKTAASEFGLSAHSDSDVARSPRSPWDLTRSAGGSSGGAAAAVAAGLVPFAHGSDAGGSLRIPAGACGVFGFKPSRGRVSGGPLGVDATGLSVHGPLARTVRDAAAMLDAFAGPMPGDPYWAPPLPDGETFLGAADREPGRLRIARYADLGTPGLAVDPDCLAAYEAATAVLLELGHEVEEIPIPFGSELGLPFFTVWSARAAAWPVAPADEHLLRPLTRWWRECGRTVSGAQLLDAMSALQRFALRAVTATAPYDAVLTPTLAMPPQPPGWFSGDEAGDDRDFEGELARQTAFTPYTGIYNATGQPAANLPLHWNAQGLPIGVTLAGRPAADAHLISLCAQVEAANPWAHRRPLLHTTLNEED